jgi:hypothetical protein
MNPITLSRITFATAAIYDLCLGLAFLIVPALVFNQFQLAAPGHWGYVQFPAALLLVFAVMFLNITRDPIGKVELIPYGILLKLAYVIVVFGHWFFAEVPNLWKPFAMIDLLFLLAFAWCYSTIRSFESRTES